MYLGRSRATEAGNAEPWNWVAVGFQEHREVLNGWSGRSKGRGEEDEDQEVTKALHEGHCGPTESSGVHPKWDVGNFWRVKSEGETWAYWGFKRIASGCYMERQLKSIWNLCIYVYDIWSLVFLLVLDRFRFWSYRYTSKMHLNTWYFSNPLLYNTSQINWDAYLFFFPYYENNLNSISTIYPLKFQNFILGGQIWKILSLLNSLFELCVGF